MLALAALDDADALALVPWSAAAVAGPISISAAPCAQPLADPVLLIPAVITSPAAPTHSDAAPMDDGLDAGRPTVAVFELPALAEPLTPALFEAGAPDAVTAALLLVEPLTPALIDADDGELPPEALTAALVPVPADPCPLTEIDGNGSVPTAAVPATPADPSSGNVGPMPTAPIGLP